MGSISIFDSFSQHMGTGVPESLFALRLIKVVEHNFAVRIQGAHHVPGLHFHILIGVEYFFIFFIFASHGSLFESEGRFGGVLDRRDHKAFCQFLGDLLGLKLKDKESTIS